MTDRATFGVKDATLSQTAALPNGNGAATNVTGFHLQSLTTRGACLTEFELLIECPALAAAKLPDGKLLTFSVQTDTTSAFGSPTTIADAVLVITGATAGAAAASARFRMPSNCEDYVRVVATNAASAAGDASAASMTVSILC